MALNAYEFVDGLDHVHRDANRAGLVSDGARDGLANPPGCVRRELVALLVVEFLDCTDKAQVAFLDEVEEQHATANVTLGDGHDQAQVRFDELLLRIEAHLLDTAEATHLATGQLDAFVLCSLDFLGSCDAGLDLHGEVNLFGSREQRNFADFLQIHANRVAGEHRDARVGRAAARRLGLRARRDLGQHNIACRFQLFFGNTFEQFLFGLFYMDAILLCLFKLGCWSILVLVDIVVEFIFSCHIVGGNFFRRFRWSFLCKLCLFFVRRSLLGGLFSCRLLGGGFFPSLLCSGLFYGLVICHFFNLLFYRFDDLFLFRFRLLLCCC